MVFWLGILAGALFAWLAVRIGFYETWTMLFNIIISIYLAIFLTLVVTDIIPAAAEISCGNALTLIAIAIGTFLVLHGISYTFFTGQFKVPFPKIFDMLFAGLLGFLAGFLVLSFIALLICTTPISQNNFAKDIGLSRPAQQANISYICWWCDLVSSIVSSPENRTSTQQVIDELLTSEQPKPKPKPSEPQPDNPDEPNAPKSTIGKETTLLVSHRSLRA